MLIGLAGKLTGYNGSFAFSKPGDKFEDHPYVGMRLFCATLGALIIPFSFLIVWELTESLFPSFLAAIILTFGKASFVIPKFCIAFHAFSPIKTSFSHSFQTLAC